MGVKTSQQAGERVAIPLPSLRLVALGIYAAVNGLLIAVLVNHNLIGWSAPDWRLWERLPVLYSSGELYDPLKPAFVFSPVAALILIAILPIGFVGWSLLHLAALGFLRRWPTILFLTLISFAFWGDLTAGHMTVFVAIAGALAISGGRTAGLVYVAFCVLMPRPLQLPLLVWLMWKQPTWRLPAILIAAALMFASLATGYLDEWLSTSLAMSQQYREFLFNWGPTRLLGDTWFIVGVPLSIWLTWRGWPGLAGLAISPYILPQYFLMLIVDLVKWSNDRSAAQAANDVQPATAAASSPTAAS
jgi:hypothetical protein